MSRSIILREALDQIVLGNIDSKTVSDKFSDLSREEFDKLMNEALFDIWIVSGDKGYFSKGYHTEKSYNYENNFCCVEIIFCH